MNRLLARLLGRAFRDDNPDDAGGGAADDGVRYAFRDRAAWLEQIAGTTEDDVKFGTGTHDDDDQSGAGGAEDQGGGEGGVQETDEERAAREAQEQADADAASAEEARVAAEQAARTGEEQMVTLIVDGKEVQKPLSEVLDAGRRFLQKDMTADERLVEATRILKEAQKVQGGEHQPAEKRPSESVQEDDDAELARAIQLGSDEEARAAISKLRRSGRADDTSITSMIDARIEFREAASWVQSEYKDLLTDPLLGGVFMQKEAEARAAGDKRPYRDLYKEIGDGLRKWRDGLAPKVNQTQDKEDRKANNVTTLPTAASAKAPVNRDEGEPEGDDAEDTQAFIAEQRRRRGQA